MNRIAFEGERNERGTSNQKAKVTDVITSIENRDQHFGPCLGILRK